MAQQDRLWGLLQDARREYLEAAKATSALVAEAPSGMPAGDGSHRMALASAVQRLGFEKYRKAAAEYSKAVRSEGK